MRNEPVEDTVRSALRDEIAKRYESTETLRALLELRADDPFAPPALGRLVGSQRMFLEGVRAGFRYVSERSPDSPLTWHWRLRGRLHGADVSAQAASAPPGQPPPPPPPLPPPAVVPSMRPSGTPRDVIEFNGFRLTHALAIACEVLGMLGPEFQTSDLVDAWRWVFGTSTYAMVLAAGLGRCEDTAFGGAFVVGATRLLVAHDAGSLLTRQADRLAVARGVAECWALPASVLTAFAPDGPRDSLADIVGRARVAAARHGFVDPLGSTPGAGEETVPLVDGEPILDEYLQESGGRRVVKVGVGAMMAITLIAVD